MVSCRMYNPRCTTRSKTTMASSVWNSARVIRVISTTRIALTRANHSSADRIIHSPASTNTAADMAMPPKPRTARKWAMSSTLVMATASAAASPAMSILRR